MEFSFFEDALNQARSIEDIFKDKMTIDEARKYISKYIATSRNKFDKSTSGSEKKFMSERLKLAYAIKTVVADKLNVKSGKIGLSVERENMEQPNDMTPEIFNFVKDSKAHGGSWWDFKYQTKSGDIKVKDNEFIGVVSLSKYHLLNNDTRSFVRLLCHELGHTRQTVLGTLENEADEKVWNTTSKYLAANPNKTERKIVWNKKFIEKDADAFADSMCRQFISDACKDHGLNGYLLSMKYRALKTEVQSKMNHLKGSCLYPFVEAKAKKYNSQQSAQEPQPGGE